MNASVQSTEVCQTLISVVQIVLLAICGAFLHIFAFSFSPQKCFVLLANGAVSKLEFLKIDERYVKVPECVGSK